MSFSMCMGSLARTGRKAWPSTNAVIHAGAALVPSAIRPLAQAAVWRGLR